MTEMNSFQDAFYIIAKELGFDYAQPLSPREVFEQQMLPRIRELIVSETMQQKTQTIDFQREGRYIVIKRKDLDRLPMEMRLPFSMALNELAPRLPKRECLVIESDWPEYEPTWAAIQARMTEESK